MNKTSRLPRRARVTRTRTLCPTGTVVVSFEVLDDEPFEFEPGQFVAIDMDHPRLGYRRSPYCICTPPRRRRTFDLLVRVIPEGPVSVFLGELEPGDVIGFRGPSGAVMTPPDDEHDLVLMATGVGISPFCALVPTLLGGGFPRQVTLYWGLRLVDDVCLTDCLEQWRAEAAFRYAITLSRPPAGWRGLRGRITESVPPLLERLGDKRFLLSGNGAMIAEMRDALSLAGVPQHRIFEEYFFNVGYRPRWDDVEAIRARFVAADATAPLAMARELETHGR